MAMTAGAQNVWTPGRPWATYLGSKIGIGALHH